MPNSSSEKSNGESACLVSSYVCRSVLLLLAVCVLLKSLIRNKKLARGSVTIELSYERGEIYRTGANRTVLF